MADSLRIPRTNAIAKMCVGKKQYKTENAALTTSITRLGAKHGPIQLRVYKCPHCNFYHLTSKERR